MSEPPRRRSLPFQLLYDFTNKVLPIAFFLYFLIAGTAVLIYNLGLREAPPKKLLIGCTIAFGVLTGLTAFGQTILYCRRKYGRRFDVEDGSMTGTPKSNHEPLPLPRWKRYWLEGKSFLASLQRRMKGLPEDGKISGLSPTNDNATHNEELGLNSHAFGSHNGRQQGANDQRDEPNRDLQSQTGTLSEQVHTRAGRFGTSRPDGSPYPSYRSGIGPSTHVSTGHPPVSQLYPYSNITVQSQHSYGPAEVPANYSTSYAPRRNGRPRPPSSVSGNDNLMAHHPHPNQAPQRSVSTISTSHHNNNDYSGRPASQPIPPQLRAPPSLMAIPELNPYAYRVMVSDYDIIFQVPFSSNKYLTEKHKHDSGIALDSEIVSKSPRPLSVVINPASEVFPLAQKSLPISNSNDDSFSFSIEDGNTDPPSFRSTLATSTGQEACLPISEPGRDPSNSIAERQESSTPQANTAHLKGSDEIDVRNLRRTKKSRDMLEESAKCSPKSSRRSLLNKQRIRDEEMVTSHSGYQNKTDLISKSSDSAPRSDKELLRKYVVDKKLGVTKSRSQRKGKDFAQMSVKSAPNGKHKASLLTSDSMPKGKEIKDGQLGTPPVGVDLRQLAATRNRIRVAGSSQLVQFRPSDIEFRETEVRNLTFEEHQLTPIPRTMGGYRTPEDLSDREAANAIVSRPPRPTTIDSGVKEQWEKILQGLKKMEDEK